MCAKICILIENTPRSMTMPNVGLPVGPTFAVWARNRFIAYDRLIRGLHIIANGVATFTHHTGGSFLRNLNVFVTL